MPSDALDLTGVQLSHTAVGTKIKSWFSSVKGFLHCCIAWLEVLCDWSALHHSFEGARCVPRAQWCFFCSSCRIWHWAWIPIRPRMQREGALLWLSYSTGWQKHLVQHPEGRSYPNCDHDRKRNHSFHKELWRLQLVACPHQRAEIGKRWGRGSTIQTPSWIVCAVSSRIVQ